MIAPEMMASRSDSLRSSRAFCTISLSSVRSIFAISDSLAESASIQSMYERLSRSRRPFSRLSTRSA